MTGYAWPMTRDAHALDKLREMYPGWRIWHVPSPSGPGTWCAQPLPLINVGSPDELMRAIENADVAKDPKYAAQVDAALRDVEADRQGRVREY